MSTFALRLVYRSTVALLILCQLQFEVQAQAQGCWGMPPIGNKQNIEPCYQACNKSCHNESALLDLTNNTVLDFSGCLGHCAHPVQPYCQEGYLSQFFYCDCHNCCTQISNTAESHLCSMGCFDWFYHQWSPYPKEGCLSTIEYTSASANDWCTAWCTWAIATKRTITVPNYNDIQTIMSNHSGPCKDMCVRLTGTGQVIDYSTPTKCDPATSPTHCFSLLKAYKFVILTPVDQALLTAHEGWFEGGWQKWGCSLPNRAATAGRQARNRTQSFTHEAFIYHSDSLGDTGIGKEVKLEAETSATMELNDTSGKVPQGALKDLLIAGYSGSSSFVTANSPITVPTVCSPGPCVNHTVSPTIGGAGSYGGNNFQLQYEVYLKVSDHLSLFPRTADELKGFIPLYNALRDFHYVSNHDAFTINVKTNGSIRLERLGFEIEYTDDCEFLDNCCGSVATCTPTPECT